MPAYVQVQPSSPEPSCIKTQSLSEAKPVLTEAVAEAVVAEKQPVEEKLELPEPAQPQAEIKTSEVEVPRVCFPIQSPTQDTQPSTAESPKNKRKVCFSPLIFYHGYKSKTLNHSGDSV